MFKHVYDLTIFTQSFKIREKRQSCHIIHKPLTCIYIYICALGSFTLWQLLVFVSLHPFDCVRGTPRVAFVSVCLCSSFDPCHGIAPFESTHRKLAVAGPQLGRRRAASSYQSAAQSLVGRPWLQNECKNMPEAPVVSWLGGEGSSGAGAFEAQKR